jgi:hypothetical protein
VASAWLAELERVLPDTPEADRFVLLAAAAGEAVRLDPAEARAVVRRALLLHVAGGNALRPYALDGRAVTAAAEEIDEPERRAELQRGLERLLSAAAGLPHASESLAALLADPELGWRAYACSVVLEGIEDDG